MSQRPGILTTVRVSAHDRWPLTKSPNQQPDVITAEIRCHWPYLAPQHEVLRALLETYQQAVTEVNEYYEDRA